jgi:hypothetical protein
VTPEAPAPPPAAGKRPGKLGAWARTHKPQAAAGVAGLGVVGLVAYKKHKASTASTSSSSAADSSAAAAAAAQQAYPTSYPLTDTSPDTQGYAADYGVSDQPDLLSLDEQVASLAASVNQLEAAQKPKTPTPAPPPKPKPPTPPPPPKKPTPPPKK